MQSYCRDLTICQDMTGGRQSDRCAPRGLSGTEVGTILATINPVHISVQTFAPRGLSCCCCCGSSGANGMGATLARRPLRMMTSSPEALPTHTNDRNIELSPVILQCSGFPVDKTA